MEDRTTFTSTRVFVETPGFKPSATLTLGSSVDGDAISGDVMANVVSVVVTKTVVRWQYTNETYRTILGFYNAHNYTWIL